MEPLFSLLKELEIACEEFSHPPLFTCEDAKKYWDPIDAMQVKNLFLHNRNKTAFYLIILPDSKKVDLKKFKNIIESSALSFAKSELLEKYLKVTPGSVSVFSLMNDSKKEVKVILDKELKSADFLLFHPNVNTKTLKVGQMDLEKFLKHTGHQVNYLEIK